MNGAEQLTIRTSMASLLILLPDRISRSFDIAFYKDFDYIFRIFCCNVCICPLFLLLSLNLPHVCVVN